jgi:hypothetical protein
MGVQHFAWNATQSMLILSFGRQLVFNEELMRISIKKFGIAALAAVSLAGATLATSTDADARWRGHGGHRGGGWVGPAIVGGLALGALTASRPYYGPAYGAYDGCIRNRVVGHTAYGRPIVRPVNVC